MRKEFHLHLVSGLTGEITQGVVRTCMTQFAGIEVSQHLWPMVRSESELEVVLKSIRNDPGPVLFTRVNETTRAALRHECELLDVPCISVIDPIIGDLGSYFYRSESGLTGGLYVEQPIGPRISETSKPTKDAGLGSDGVDVVAGARSRQESPLTCFVRSMRSMLSA